MNILNRNLFKIYTSCHENNFNGFVGKPFTVTQITLPDLHFMPHLEDTTSKMSDFASALAFQSLNFCD